MDGTRIINGVVGGVMPLLAISGAAAATIKTTNAINVKIDGVVSTVAAATLAAVPVTVTVPIASTAVVGVYVVAAGTASYVMSTPVLNTAIAANTIWPSTNSVPQEVPGKALIGWVVVKATTTAFTGGTTAFDAATYTVTYIDKPAVTL
jgi:hypothetical protein